MIDAYGCRQETIHRTPEIIWWNWILKTDGGHLGKRVYTSIGAAGRDNLYGFSLNAPDDVLKNALDGRQSGLHLPAVKPGSIVGDFEAEAAGLVGGAIFHRVFRRGAIRV